MPFSKPPTSDPLIGQVFEAAVIHKHTDSCDFRLANGQRVRLYQRDSLAAEHADLMAQLSQYALGERCCFLITHQRTDHKEVLYYANERWAENNPWENLPLKQGDVVEGTVVALIYGERDVLKGYYLQLDTTLHIGRQILKPLQPDILVFLPVEEIPWDDGSLGQRSKATQRRLKLEKGDRTRIVLTEIHALPLYPTGSLLRCVERQDALFWDEANNTIAAAWIKERLHQPHLPPSPTYLIEELFRLDGYHFLLLDDREDSLEMLQNVLQKNGATVSTLRKQANWSNDELLENLVAHLTLAPPDLLLVDNALPHPDDGLHLLKRLFTQFADKIHLPHCALMSSLFLTDDMQRIKTQLPALQGALLRPLNPIQLLNLCKGEKVWSEGVHTLSSKTEISADEDLQHYFRGLVQDKILDSITMLDVNQGKVVWESSVGEQAIPPERLQQVIQESELRLLLDQKISVVMVRRGDYPENNLLGRSLNESHWFRVNLFEGLQTKLIGLGWKNKGQDILSRVLQDAIRSKYQQQTWQLWAQHQANFISSGITVHSLVHEHRHYLNQLQIGLETLKLAVSVGKLDKVATQPDILLNTVRNMTDLTTTLLQGQAQRNVAVYLPDLLQLLKQMVTATAKESRVDFRILIPPRLSLGIAAANLTVPLINLVLNAFKHHTRQQARKVVLTTQIQRHNQEYWLDFQVCDNGAGIAAYQLPRLFHAGVSFAQQSEQRHGIGLWLARQLARQIGGEVLLSQNLRGLGACFTLRIPLQLA